MRGEAEEKERQGKRGKGTDSTAVKSRGYANKMHTDSHSSTGKCEAKENIDY